MQVTSPRHVLSREGGLPAPSQPSPVKGKRGLQQGRQPLPLRPSDSGDCEKELSRVKCTRRERVQAVGAVRRQRDPLALLVFVEGD